MAALTRRTWAETLTEVTRRHGGVNYSGFDTRMKYWLAESYLELALLYHHFEFDKIDTSKTLSTSVNSLALPTDCFSLIAIRIKDASGNSLGQLSPYDAASLLTDYSASVPGPPTRYARFGGSIYVNKLPDQAYPLDLYYYATPALPDFSGTDSPLTSVDCDEAIMRGALDLAHGSTGRPDLGDVYRQRLDAWLAAQVRSSVVEQQIPQQREGWSTQKTLGSAQG